MNSLVQDGPTDPSDWSFGPLKELDALLRCSICFEYFRTAMILSSCSHTYCSLCIRKFLLVRPQCPTCSAPAKESQLVNNRPLDELVEAFVKSREDFMKALEHAHHGLGVKGEQLSVAHGDRLASQLPAQVSEPIQKRTARVPRPARGPAIVTPPPVAKVPLPPCRMPMSLVVGEEEEPLPSNGQLGDSGHDWLHPASATSPIVIHDDGDGEEVVVAEDLNSTSSTSMLSHEMMSSSTAMLPGEMMSSSSSSSLPACQRVKCPICGLTLHEKLINMHLDQCLQKSECSSSSSSSSTNSSVQQKPKKLPKIVWNLLKDKDLKKKLKEYHLLPPPTGRRHDMIQRLQEFTVRYNAQSDSLNPRTMEQVADDMAKDDLARQSSVSGSPSSNMQVPKGCTDEEIEHLRKKYESQHKDHFVQLAQELRHRTELSPPHPPPPPPPPPPATTFPPLSDIATSSSSSPATVTMATPAYDCLPDGREEPTVPDSSWQKRLRRSKSKKGDASCAWRDSTASSDDNNEKVCDNDSSDEDFVETRRAKRLKQ